MIMLLEIRSLVRLPGQLTNEVIEIPLMIGGHILDAEIPGYRPAVHHRFKNGEHIRAPLRLERHERPRGMQNSWRNQPPAPHPKTVRAAVIEDAVVSLRPPLQALYNLAP